MCMDHGSFLLVRGEEESSLDHVATLLPVQEGLRMVDVYGKTSQIPGRVEEIDLLNRRIVLA